MTEEAPNVPAKEPSLFGHPVGLSYLFTTEMWERFSYYGMRSILIYTLINYLLLHPTADNVLGYEQLKRFFELIYNGGQPLAPQPLSSIIYGNYTSFVYLTPIIGGIIADRWLGQLKSVVIGAVTMAAGEFILAVPQLFFLGLLLLIIGNGLFKPNISTQVGKLYQPGDTRIDRAFSIFYVGINIGAFLSPLVCGSLGEVYGYHWGYLAAGTGMVIGLITYLFALRKLPQDRVTRIKTAKEEKKPLTSEDWKATIALFLLLIPGSLFWAVFEQQGNTIALFAQDLTDRRLVPGLIDWQIPYTWFQSFGAGFIVLLTPLVIAIWSWQAKRNREPSVLTKMALGSVMLGLGYMVMVAAVGSIGPQEPVSWLWLLVFFAVITLGELYFSPVGLALTVRVAPPQILSMMMGVWLLTNFAGNQLQGFIGSYFSRISKEEFFLLCAAIGFLAGAVFWFFNFPLKRILDSRRNRSQQEAQTDLESPQAA